MMQTGMLHSRDDITDVYKHVSLPPQTLVYENVRFPYNLNADPGLGTRNHTITVELDRKSADEEGVLVSKGDRFGGISLYVKDNKPKFVYNLDTDTYWIAQSSEELPLGKVTVRLQFEVTGHKKAVATLYINDKKVGDAHIEDFFYTVGAGSLVSLKWNKFTSVYDADYASPFEYNGTIDRIVMDLPASELDAEEDLNKALHVE
jgi:arylsulfatase